MKVCAKNTEDRQVTEIYTKKHFKFKQLKRSVKNEDFFYINE